MNQSSMMTQVGSHLSHHDVWFAPFHTDGLMKVFEKGRLLEWTVAGKQHQSRSIAHAREAGFAIDEHGDRNRYDLVVTTSDLYLQKKIRRSDIVLVQEGMTDPDNLAYYLVRYLGLPRYLASTSTFGLSDSYVKLCVASHGYRDHFVSRGVKPEKIEVTGIPNFDNCRSALDEPFELKGEEYVLVATSDARETFKYENRKRFIRRAQEIADGRRLVFKLHPNEKVGRAKKEIEKWAPEALVFADRPIEPFVANCEVLITRFSSVVYLGIALGKEVYSEFPISKLKSMCPLQNGGRSAESIAAVCEDVLSQQVRVFPVMANTTSWSKTG